MTNDLATLKNSRKFSVAPMLDWTDKNCRYFLRQISKHTLLYTEMVTTGAIIHGKYDFLDYNEEEHSVALQLGGSDPKALAHCAKRAEERSYDEINLNVGCPSDRVQNGRFGACLMAEPALVADCIKAMQDVVSIPVTVKTRIGIDDQDSYPFLCDFIQTVSNIGCEHFIIHARKAWLSGLSPKDNREIPPLDYQRVYQIKQDFPHLEIAINGNIKTIGETLEHLTHIDGVMMGREAYQNPFLLSQVDEKVFGAPTRELSRHDVAEQMLPYIEKQVKEGAKAWHIARHMLGLFQGQPGARSWRRHLSTYGPKSDEGIKLIKDALDLVPR